MNILENLNEIKEQIGKLESNLKDEFDCEYSYKYPFLCNSRLGKNGGMELRMKLIDAYHSIRKSIELINSEQERWDKMLEFDNWYSKASPKERLEYAVKHNDGLSLSAYLRDPEYKKLINELPDGWWYKNEA